jgi:hypothetical protein
MWLYAAIEDDVKNKDFIYEYGNSPHNFVTVGVKELLDYRKKVESVVNKFIDRHHVSNSIVFYYYAKMMVEPKKLELTPYILRSLELPYLYKPDPSNKSLYVIKVSKDRLQRFETFYEKVERAYAYANIKTDRNVLLKIVDF